MSSLTLSRPQPRPNISFSLKALVPFVCALLVTAVACADDATDRLLHLVGKDVGLCVEIPHLEEHLTHLRHSDFARRLEGSALHKKWLATGESQKLRRSRESIEKHTGKSIDQLASDIFGNAVIVAVYGSPTGGAAGVLLTEADSVELLDATIDSWNKAEPQTTVSREHAGLPYFIRSRTTSEPSNVKPLFYTKLDRVFALSDHEEMILKVLDLEALRRHADANNTGNEAASQESLSQSETYRQARGALSSNPCVAAYLNPRAWDHFFPARETGPQDAQVVGRVWRRLESVALGLDLKQGCVLETIVHYDGQNAPADWNSSLERMQGSPEFLRHVPANAVALFAGRHDLAGLAGFVVKQASAEIEQQQWESFRQVSRGLLLGLDLFDDVLPGLKPNWGGYVVASETPEESPYAIPLDGLVAFEFSADPPAEGKAALRDALDNGLNTGMNLVAAWFNSTGSKTPAVVRSTEQPESVIRWIEGIPDYRPTYLLTKNHLAFASTPELAKEFQSSPSEDAARHRGFDRSRTSYFPNENQVAFVDLAALRKLMESYRTRLVERAAEANALSTEDCEERLTRLLDVASLVDSAFIAGHIDGSHFRLVLGGVVEEAAESPASAKP